MKHLLVLLLVLVFTFSLTAQTQTFTVAADSTNATFSYSLDASHSYTFTITGFYKTPQVYIRPAFNPDNQYLADWNGNIYPWSGANYIKNWTNILANQSYFEVPNLPGSTKKKPTINVWTPYSCSFQISNISTSGTFPLYLNNHTGTPFGLVWQGGTVITITKN